MARQSGGEESRRRQFSEILFRNPAVLISALGLVLYAFSRGGYQIYYAHYGVTPEEVGLDYVTVLSREALPISLLLLILVALILPMIQSTRLRSGGTEIEPSVRGPDLSNTRLMVQCTLAGVALLGWLVVILATASAPGVGPYRPFAPVAPLQVEVHQTRAYWVDKDGTRTRPITSADLGLSKNCKPNLLYLGQAGSVVVLYERCTGEVVRLPRDRVYLA
jgi:hypothetical protein